MNIKLIIRIMENPNIKSALRNDQIETLKIRINTLLQQIEKHQKTQNLNDKLLRFERLLSKLSSRLINLAPGETKKQIEYSFGLPASFLDVDQIGIVGYLNESRSV